MGDSNPRPIDCEPIALPTELIPQEPPCAEQLQARHDLNCILQPEALDQELSDSVFFRESCKEVAQELIPAKTVILVTPVSEQSADLGLGNLETGQLQNGANIVVPQFESYAEGFEHLVVAGIPRPWRRRASGDFPSTPPAHHKTLKEGAKGCSVAFPEALILFAQKERTQILHRERMICQGKELHQLEIGDVQGVAEAYKYVIVMAFHLTSCFSIAWLMSSMELS